MPANRPPTVEMLWEDADPHAALRDRFGFADASTAGEWVARTLAAWWALPVQSCDRIVLSDHNALAWVSTEDGGRIAKWSVLPDLFERLPAVAELAAWLEGQGVPVSGPVPAADGRLQVEVDGASVGVQRVIAGELLDVAATEQVRAAGAAVGRCHEALARYPRAGRIPGLVAPAPLSRRIDDWLRLAGPHVPDGARSTLRRMVSRCRIDPGPMHLVHGDIRAANILCDGPRVLALIDLQDARLDQRINELARGAVLLGTRFRNWAPVSGEVHAAFLDGYRSVCHVSAAEAEWWTVLILWHSLMMIPPGDDPAGWRAAAERIAQLIP